MFTGIIEEIGTIERIDLSGSAPLLIRCDRVLGGTRPGDSIAVNGVCLTVTKMRDHAFAADLQPVTLRLSNLGILHAGDPVNLERSIAADQRFGGHYVQGHIDGVARIAGISGEGPSIVVRLAMPPDLMRYIVERGFIAVDGASLTVTRLRSDGVDVSLVYHTQQHITLGRKRPGDDVNIEVDVIGKYVERLVGAPPKSEAIHDLLTRSGYV